MKNRVYGSLVSVSIVAAMLVGISAQAEEATADVKKGEARFALGVSYASGITEVGDFIEDIYDASPFHDGVDMFVIPVGLSVVGGYRFGFGLEVLGDVGPISLIMVDDIFADEYFMNLDIPLGLTVGYAFFAEKSVSPYVRGGFRYHVSVGDFTESSSPGLYVAGGINFFSNKAVNLQLEVAYDASTVTYKSPDFYYDTYGVKVEEEIEPGGLMISIRAAF